MQLTNILRDVREDRERGRVYLPAEDLRRFGCEDLASLARRRVAALIRFEAARGARVVRRAGSSSLPLLDTRSASCVLAMTGIYRRMLERIDARPELVLQRAGLAAGLGEGVGRGAQPGRSAAA